MLDEIRFLGFSLGAQFILIFGVVIVGCATVFAMDRFWSSRPSLVKDWEHVFVIATICIAVILVT